MFILYVVNMEPVIYKHFVLPAVRKPIRMLKTYLKMENPELAPEELKMKVQKLSRYERKKYNNLIADLNGQVTGQLKKYKRKFIHPLRNVPFYYDLIFQHVKHDNDLYQIIQKMPIRLKQSLLKQHIQGERGLIEKYPQFENIQRLPILIYSSPSELYTGEQPTRGWDELEDREKRKYEKEFNRMVNYYAFTLNQIALSLNMKRQVLQRLAKKQCMASPVSQLLAL